MEKRRKKDTDQEESQKAVLILLDAIQNHPEMEPTLWASACFTLLVDGFLKSGIPYEGFCRELEGVKAFYKIRWEDNDN